MAITLITGLPGNAKTLFALGMVIDKAASENRAVYHFGLTGLQLDDVRLKGTTWIELDPKTWHETVPPGAIIFGDEAQEVFRSRTLGTVPGPHVTELERHRHKGLDFFLITQHPGLIDPAIRKLTQTHYHMMRIFGAEASMVHLWRTGVRENCEKPAGRRDSEKTRWPFNKSLYGLYKSAEVHTVKKAVPKRVYFLLSVPVLLLALGVGIYFALKTFNLSPEGPKGSITTEEFKKEHPEVFEGVVSQAASPSRIDPVQDAREYLFKNTPRIDNLPETAPKYDGLTTPTRVPVPAMCIQMGDVRSGKPIRCQCYTQQATKLDVEFNMCIDIARNGRFMDFDPEPNRRRDNTAVQLADASHADRSARVLAARVPDVSMGPNYGALPVSSFTDVPSSIEGARPPPNLNDGPPPGRTTRTEVVQQ